MAFEAWFRASSYATVACGVAVLAVAGGVGWALGLCFAAVLALAWTLEGRRWQLRERTGMVVVLLSLPLFYLDWRAQGAAADQTGAGVTALVHLTLFLSSVKLLQVKSDRDWLFLYLISFFEVLLGAGMSLSPLYVVALLVYLFTGLLTVVFFELKRAQKLVSSSAQRMRVTYEGLRRGRKGRQPGVDARLRGLKRLPLAAFFLLLLVFAFALPIFYMMPRFGNRGGPSAGRGETAHVGFSDTVTLGEIGRLQQNDGLVMRVRVEGERAARGETLRWRGISLDSFDGRTWRRTSNDSTILQGGERDFFQLGTTEHLNRLTTQHFFVEPIDTAILFAAPRVVALQGSLHYVRAYRDGNALTTSPHPKERINYRAYSDAVEPPLEALRADTRRYPNEKTPNLQAPIENYLQYPPELDTGITSLAWLVINRAGARNRYDAARAIEAHLSQNAHGGEYRYSLEMRAGGDDPLADFLFNVREGHCEYFATAMAVMLRTQGIAARVVNGFQAGEYNAAADAYIVRQYDAHSWVEVYFPETDSWVTFDPTPANGRPRAPVDDSFAARMRDYAEALELFWIQYVVAYDRQEQRSLANSIRSRVSRARRSVEEAAAGFGASLSGWLGLDKSEDGAHGTGAAGWRVFIVFAAGFVLFLFVAHAGWKFYAGRVRRAEADSRGGTVVIFYARMSAALEARGLRREADQTPLEFAESLGVPEVLTITRAYHRVRFGARELSDEETREVARCLASIESAAAGERQTVASA